MTLVVCHHELLQFDLGTIPVSRIVHLYFLVVNWLTTVLEQNKYYYLLN
jgi:hypothetical protein